MARVSGYPAMPPHLAAQGVKQKEWRAFLDLLARHQALAEVKRFSLPAGARQHLPPKRNHSSAALSFHKAAAWPK